jgi:O-antigen biosynthesis protein
MTISPIEVAKQMSDSDLNAVPADGWNPLSHPIVFAEPRYLPASAWLEHIPFAMYAVDVLKPRSIVELGTHAGASFCAFCQAVANLNLSTQCFAIDSWQGDEHTGKYDCDVLGELRAHHDPHYGGFSRLIQSTFDEAAQHFSDGSVDLLHIDGYHTYEAVKHDFITWRPKMSERGVVLFHDINVRERDFGVHAFWEEIRLQHPSFEFWHCHGLGVLAVGKIVPKEFQTLLQLKDEAAARMRYFFFNLGRRHQLLQRQEQLRMQIESMGNEVAKAAQGIAESQQIIGRLQQRLEQREKELFATQQSMNAMVHSSSIRATEPLRLMSRIARRFFAKLRRTLQLKAISH